MLKLTRSLLLPVTSMRYVCAYVWLEHLVSNDSIICVSSCLDGLEMFGIFTGNWLKICGLTVLSTSNCLMMSSWLLYFFIVHRLQVSE